MTEQDNSPLSDAERANRHGAGCDPAKRNQIMVGAKRAFMERGFDAAGVNDIEISVSSAVAMFAAAYGNGTT